MFYRLVVHKGLIIIGHNTKIFLFIYSTVIYSFTHSLRAYRYILEIISFLFALRDD